MEGPGEDLELPGTLLKESDYTFYFPREGEPHNVDSFKIYSGLLESRRFAAHEFSASCSGHVYRREIDRRKYFIEGRLLICRCFRGREIAVTLRELNTSPALRSRKKEAGGDHYHHDPAKGTAAWEANSRYYDYEADEPARPGQPEKIPFPVPTGKVCELIDHLVLKRPSVGAEPTGLILVTGATNSAKSELTRGLIDRILRRQAEQYATGLRKRRPHLLTFEDPIERWLFEVVPAGARRHPGQGNHGKESEKGEPSSRIALGLGVEYTPREKGFDVASLRDAVDDALRQTPSVFYVGEVREDKDWVDLLRFAGTGHLVVATAHAGSLIEAMERIFRGVNAETPAARGQIAQRILAVIHQLKFNLQDIVPVGNGVGLPAKFEVLLPSLWRRTPGGVAALVGDGLSSVLPNTPTDPDDEDRTSSFGRRWFAQRLSKDHWEKILTRDGASAAKIAGHRIIKTLVGFDLELMPAVDGVEDIPAEREALIIVADVGGELHFRIFEGDGRIVVDKNESSLAAQADPIADLKKRLENLWPPHRLGDEEKDLLVTAVTSICGHTRLLSTAREQHASAESLKSAIESVLGAESSNLLFDIGAGLTAAIEETTQRERGSIVAGLAGLERILPTIREILARDYTHSGYHALAQQAEKHFQIEAIRYDLMGT